VALSNRFLPVRRFSHPFFRRRDAAEFSQRVLVRLDPIRFPFKLTELPGKGA
jgi:hypothetical protein